ncbi:36936_t:CDS:2, partial [Racocetra persica]
TTLAKDILGIVIISIQIHNLMTISEDKEENLEIENKFEQLANLQRVDGLQEAESIFIFVAVAKEEDDFSEGCLQLALMLDFTQPS